MSTNLNFNRTESQWTIKLSLVNFKIAAFLDVSNAGTLKFDRKNFIAYYDPIQLEYKLVEARLLFEY